MDTKQIELIIKEGNQKIPDHTIYCNPEWSVTQLKKHISETYPTKPSIEDQRIIYSGRQLNAEQTLQQIFLKDGEQYSSSSLSTGFSDGANRTPSFIIHLVQRNVASTMPQPGKTTTPIRQSPHSSFILDPASQSTESNGANRTDNSSSIHQSNLNTNPNFTPNLNFNSNFNFNPSPNPFSNLQYDRQNSYENVQDQFSSQSQQRSPFSNFPQPIPNLVIDPADIFMNFQRLMAQQQATLLTTPISTPPQSTEHGTSNFSPLGASSTTPSAQQSSPRREQNPELGPEQITLFEQMAQLIAQQVSALSNQNAPFLLPPIVSAAQTTPGHVTINRAFQIDATSSNGQPQAAFNFSGQTPSRGQPNVGPTSPPAGVVREQNPDAPQVQAAGQPPAAAQNVAGVEQGDIVDLLCHSLRGLMLLAAMYTNSSSYKLIFVLGLILFFYYARYYSIIIRYPGQQARNQNNNNRAEDANQNANVANENANQNIDQNNRPPDPNEHVGEPTQQLPVQQQQPQQVPFLRAFFSVVSAFIISLVPETV